MSDVSVDYTMISLRIPLSLADDATSVAKKKGQSRSEFVREAIMNAVANHLESERLARTAEEF